jgi:hypothetical protein
MIETKHEPVRASANTRDQRNKQQLRMRTSVICQYREQIRAKQRKSGFPQGNRTTLGKVDSSTARTEGMLDRYNLLFTAALAEKRSEQQWIVFSPA